MSREDFENRVLDELKSIRVLLTGNGDPSKGIVVRLDRAEQELKTMREGADRGRGWVRELVVGAVTAGLSALLAWCTVSAKAARPDQAQVEVRGGGGD
ncbi:MAG TPA: hypothetical protein VD994_12795 [Prosthecobacter sp.]|nr:hypothetical protein [Prosthecobacter sp.]